MIWPYGSGKEADGVLISLWFFPLILLQ